jgi:hypothetical protein
MAVGIDDAFVGEDAVGRGQLTGDGFEIAHILVLPV